MIGVVVKDGRYFNTPPTILFGKTSKLIFVKKFIKECIFVHCLCVNGVSEGSFKTDFARVRNFIPYCEHTNQNL